MGIYDRPYMREDPSGSAARGGPGAWLLDHFNHLFIAANVIVWFLANAAMAPNQPNSVVANLQLSFANLQEHHYWTLLSYSLLEVNAWNMVFNMLLIYYFGREIADLYGRANLIWFYFLAMLIPGGAFLLAAWLGNLPAWLGYGGSEAVVMAVLVLITLWTPRRMMMVFFVIPCPMFLLTPLYIILMLTAFNNYPGARVYLAAPLCGSALGLVYYFIDLRLFRGDAMTPRVGVANWIGGLFRGGKKAPPVQLRVVARREDRVDSAERRTGIDDEWDSSEPSVSAADAQRVDALLEKIARDGQNSLTEEELAFLKASSEKYRK